MSNEFENKKSIKGIIILAIVIFVLIIGTIIGAMCYIQYQDDKAKSGMAEQTLGEITFYKYTLWPGNITDTSYYLYPEESEFRTFAASYEEVSDDAQATLDNGQMTLAEVYETITENIIGSYTSAKLLSAEVISIDGYDAMEMYMTSQGDYSFTHHYIFFLYNQKLYYFGINEINGLLYEKEFETIMNTVDIDGDGKVAEEYTLNSDVSESVTLETSESTDESYLEQGIDFEELTEGSEETSEE
ncbi:MAG: hypothetical protein ACI4DS_05885 [Eubacterium sp.]